VAAGTGEAEGGADVIDRREPYHPLLKSYPDSEKVNSVSIGAETLFTRLIAQADDRAHYYADPAMVVGKLFTRRWAAGEVTLQVVEGWINELKSASLIAIYRVGGNSYLEIVGCKRASRSDVKPDIRFPERHPGGDEKHTSDKSETDTSRIRDEFVASNQTKPNQTTPLVSAGADDPSTAGRPAKIRDADTLPMGFARWWAAWPSHFRKQARKSCLAAWRKNKLEPITERVLAALEASKVSHDWMKEGGKYIPFPMTWLNRTPWESDLADLSSGGEQEASDNGFHREPVTEDLLSWGDGGEP
jgi:hypothetical protein